MGDVIYIHDYYLKSDPPPAHYVTSAQGQKAEAFAGAEGSSPGAFVPTTWYGEGKFPSTPDVHPCIL